VVTEAGLKPAVTPAGRPEAESEIDSPTPETMAVETVVAADVPAMTGTAVGLVVIEKSFGVGFGIVMTPVSALLTAHTVWAVTPPSVPYRVGAASG